MRVFLHYEECWDLKRQLDNALNNNGPRYDLVGWQAKRFYLSYGGKFEYIEWESDPFPSRLCPRCDMRVAVGELETITVYRVEEERVCRSKKEMCAYCRDSLGNMEEWPRGENGRWLRTEDCEAVA